jgi:hypothetical protein
MKIFLRVLAAICCFLAVVGFRENYNFMIRGVGLPAEAATRQGFIVGMFFVPTAVLILAIVFAVLSFAGRRK